MYAKILLLLAISFAKNCVALDFNGTDHLAGMSMMALLERKSRSNYVTFEPLGEHIQLGLDFLLPFLKIPLVRKLDAYGNEPALININTAALLSTGLLASSSTLISLLFRKFMLFGRSESSSEKRHRSENVLGNEMWSILNNFKLVYTNSSGIRVDTSVTGLLETINESFEKNDAHLVSCVQKVICTRIQVSARRVNEGNSSAVDKIIDGLLGIQWIKEFLSHTSLKAAVEARNSASWENQLHNSFCDINYSQCKLAKPEDYLFEIIQTYLRFT